MEEGQRAVSSQRVEHLLECAKRCLERRWPSRAVTLFAVDADQNIQQLVGCTIVGTIAEFEPQSIRHRNASLAVKASQSIEKRPIQHRSKLYKEVGDSVTGSDGLL